MPCLRQKSKLFSPLARSQSASPSNRANCRRSFAFVRVPAGRNLPGVPHFDWTGFREAGQVVLSGSTSAGTYPRNYCKLTKFLTPFHKSCYVKSRRGTKPVAFMISPIWDIVRVQSSRNLSSLRPRSATGAICLIHRT
jgi:hypothetical protein